MALTAGLLLLGIAVIYAIFGSGVTPLANSINGNLKNITLAEVGDAPDLSSGDEGLSGEGGGIGELLAFLGDDIVAALGAEVDGGLFVMDNDTVEYAYVTAGGEYVRQSWSDLNWSRNSDQSINVMDSSGNTIGTYDRDVLGGFKRSSQHSNRGGCDDGEDVALGLVRAESPAFTWPADRGAVRASPAVLEIDCGGTLERGRCRRCRSIAGRGDQMVPGGRRHATNASIAFFEAAFGALSVVHRARGDRAAASPRARRARDCAPSWAGAVSVQPCIVRSRCLPGSAVARSS